MNSVQARRALVPAMGSLGLLLLSTPAAAQVVHYGCQADQILEQVSPAHLDHMGHSIAIGDFNGDGIKDIVMGGYDRLDPGSTQPYKTSVFVLLGTGASPSSNLPLFRHRVTIVSSATSSESFDLFGYAVTFIGDVDGDEYDDLVVGAPKFGPTDAGRVSIFKALPGLSPTDDGVIELDDAEDEYLSFNGTIDGGWFGASLATARGSNGAVLKDLLIGAPGNGPVATSPVLGSIYLYQAPTVVDAGTLASAMPGVAIAAGVAAGTPGISGTPTTGYTVTAHRLLDGLHGGDCFGWSVAFAGNVDGQVGQEFLVGAPQWAAESGLGDTRGPGYVQLFRMGSSTALIKIDGDQQPVNEPRKEGEAFGFSVAGGISLNQDTVPDLVIGAPLFNSDATEIEPGHAQAGRVRVFNGASAAINVKAALLDDALGTNGTALFSETPGEWFGYSVAVLPAIGLDGAPDILVGAERATIASSLVCGSSASLRTGYGGYAALYTTGGTPPGEQLAKFYGEAFKDHLGRAVAVDDLYGTSGRPEIILSGPGCNPEGQTNPAEVGRGYVWNGDTVLQ